MSIQLVRCALVVGLALDFVDEEACTKQGVKKKDQAPAGSITRMAWRIRKGPNHATDSL